MFVVVIDGKKIAQEIIAGLGGSLRGKKLGIVVGSDDAATDSFVKIKSRVAQRLGVSVIRGSLDELTKSCDGIIIQLPHPNAEELLAALPADKDVDGMGRSPIVRPPVVEAISEILVRNNVSVVNKWAVVVGAGRLVGLPAAQFLRSLGAHVSVVTNTRGSLEELEDADIVVLGAGSPNLVQPEMLKEGVVLIDAGTSEAGGRLVGDANPECAKAASVFTPVPGGIGPIAVAMIFKNLFALVRRENS